MRHLSQNEIAIRIVPTHLRWPDASTSVVWRQLHECVLQFYEFARAFDDDCLEIEQSKVFSSNEIVRRRAEAGREAIRQLAGFRPFESASSAVTREVERLHRREDLTPQESEAKQKLIKALDDLRGGLAAVERLLLERSKLRQISPA
ncbi:hypothetical protein ML401_20250 [Bradyrhizobium sp. 62B]|uniref:hypothetical protein n=1 Tax=Bradyrhizobium sp. 62B TaxID=2898442 RepID=UPI002557E647|nr:hypothetical protein ML401_20250 [Bradyrhizobium sp. 62B]